MKEVEGGIHRIESIFGFAPAPPNPYASEEWDALVAEWRSLYSQELETLWEFAAAATKAVDAFGDEALEWFARDVRHPARMMRRGVEAYRNSLIKERSNLSSRRR
jgi:hypothetical protein